MIVLIKELYQINNHAFSVLWSDEKKSTFYLSDLQKNCPCARCQGSLREDFLNEKEVRAVKISSVGNYALRIDFTEGCSRGIFTFSFLRKLHVEEM